MGKFARKIKRNILGINVGHKNGLTGAAKSIQRMAKSPLIAMGIYEMIEAHKKNPDADLRPMLTPETIREFKTLFGLSADDVKNVKKDKQVLSMYLDIIADNEEMNKFFQAMPEYKNQLNSLLDSVKAPDIINYMDAEYRYNLIYNMDEKKIAELTPEQKRERASYLDSYTNSRIIKFFATARNRDNIIMWGTRFDALAKEHELSYDSDFINELTSTKDIQKATALVKQYRTKVHETLAAYFEKKTNELEDKFQAIKDLKIIKCHTEKDLNMCEFLSKHLYLFLISVGMQEASLSKKRNEETTLDEKLYPLYLETMKEPLNSEFFTFKNEYMFAKSYAVFFSALMATIDNAIYSKDYPYIKYAITHLKDITYSIAVCKSKYDIELIEPFARERYLNILYLIQYLIKHYNSWKRIESKHVTGAVMHHTDAAKLIKAREEYRFDYEYESKRIDETLNELRKDVAEEPVEEDNKKDEKQHKDRHNHSK